MFSCFSFWLLRASGGCVLLNISEPTGLLGRGCGTRRNGVIAGMLVAEDRNGAGRLQLMVNFS